MVEINRKRRNDNLSCRQIFYILYSLIFFRGSSKRYNKGNFTWKAASDAVRLQASQCECAKSFLIFSLFFILNYIIYKIVLFCCKLQAAFHQLNGENQQQYYCIISKVWFIDSARRYTCVLTLQSVSRSEVIFKMLCFPLSFNYCSIYILHLFQLLIILNFIKYKKNQIN